MDLSIWPFVLTTINKTTHGQKNKHTNRRTHSLQDIYNWGEKVMLDKDLAELYNVSTGNLNTAVKRNLKRFPDDFRFQLSDLEYKNLILQSATSSWGGIRKLPYAFTEQGVAMLSGILNSDRAIEVNIQIMRIFTKLRKMYLDTTEIRLDIEKIKKKVENHSKNSEIVFNYLDQLSTRVDEIEKQQKQDPDSYRDRKRIGFKAK